MFTHATTVKMKHEDPQLFPSLLCRNFAIVGLQKWRKEALSCST